MAALYASCLHSEAMEPFVRQLVRNFNYFNMILDSTLPILSYFTGKSLSKCLQSVFGQHTEIEDLWIRFFCTTTNIRRMKLNVHSRGTLWDKVRASMTVIGLFPPMILEGDVLVDGGYTNNLPVDVMAKFCSTIVAVDVEDKDNSDFVDIENYGNGVSGWWILFCRLTGWRKVPDNGTILLWLACMSHTGQLKKAQAQKVACLPLRAWCALLFCVSSVLRVSCMRESMLPY